MFEHTGEILAELLFHFHGTIVEFFGLFFGRSFDHFPVIRNAFCIIIISRIVVIGANITYSCGLRFTYIMDSTDFGLTNIAIGCN